jgi:hypothetical protein
MQHQKEQNKAKPSTKQKNAHNTAKQKTHATKESSGRKANGSWSEEGIDDHLESARPVNGHQTRDDDQIADETVSP